MLYNLVSERIGRNLRNDLYKSLVNKDVEFFDSRKTGDLRIHYLWYLIPNIVSRLGSDIEVIQDGISTNVSMFLRSFIFIAVSFGFLFVISWVMTLVTLATILPVVIFGVFYGKKMKVA